LSDPAFHPLGQAIVEEKTICPSCSFFRSEVESLFFIENTVENNRRPVILDATNL
jgi:hypothetical protein